MGVVYAVLAALLLVFALVDILWTTLWPDGAAGPLSSRLSTVLWRALLRLGRKRRRFVSAAGPIIVAATLLLWIAMLLAGWLLVFSVDPDSLLDVTATGDAVSWIGRFYFVAYSMFTMGNGDFVPAEGWPQVAAAFTTASGMVVVTLSVTYLLSVIRAVAAKRSFASTVRGLGESSEAIVRQGWDGKDFHSLDLALMTLSSQLASLADQHKAYPVLHYYHSEDRRDASAVAVATLDDAMTLVEHGVEAPAINRAALAAARSSVTSYLETLQSAFIEAADSPPPPPSLADLRAASIPVVDEETFARSLAALDDRRRRLLGVVRADAWEWPGETRSAS